MEKKHRPVCGIAAGLRSHLWQNKGQGLFLVLRLETQLRCPLEKARDERKGLELNDKGLELNERKGLELKGLELN